MFTNVSSVQSSLVVGEMTNAMENIAITTQENAESTSIVNQTLEEQVKIFDDVEKIGATINEMATSLNELTKDYTV